MNKYRQVAMSYLTRKILLLTAVFSLVLSLGFLCHLMTHPGEVLVVVLPQMLMGVAFPVFLIGVHLKQQIASPRATLVPGYRRPHLVVAAILTAIPVALVMLGMSQSSWSVSGLLALVLYVCSLSLYLGASPGPLPLLGYILGILFPIIPHFRAVLGEMLMGRQPWLVWSLISAEVASIVLLVDHLLKLKEDDPDYGKVQQFNVWDVRASTVRNQQRTQMAYYEWMLNTLLLPTSWRLDRVTKQPARTLRQRVALLRLGDNWPANPFMTALIIGSVEYFMLHESRVHLTTERAFRTALSMPLLFSFVLGWAHWGPFLHRWPRLGYESLRPFTRQQWVQESGLAVLRSMSSHLALWLVVQLTLLFCFLREFSTSPVIWEAVAWVVGGQVLVFGASAWMSSFGAGYWRLFGMTMVIALVTVPWSLLSVGPAVTPVPFGYVLGLAGTVIGFVITGLAYRRWCRVDLA